MRSGLAVATLEPRSALGTGIDEAPVIVCDQPGLRIVEEPFLSVRSLRRSRIASPDIAPLVPGLKAPEAPNCFSGDATLSWAWVEPHAWLIMGVAEIADVPHPFMVTEISDRLAAFRISGERAAELLAAASAAALPSVLGERRCIRTKFADEAEVVMQRLGSDGYRLLIDVGLARYAASWLGDAAGLQQ